LLENIVMTRIAIFGTPGAGKSTVAEAQALAGALRGSCRFTCRPKAEVTLSALRGSRKGSCMASELRRKRGRVGIEG
jgi:nitrogenase subunit NifH